MPETPEAVIEFGPDQDDDDETAAPRRRFSVGAFLTGLAGDRRLVPVAAGIGAIALFGSLISEWQVTNVDGTAFRGTEVGDRPLLTTLADLGGWSGGYLAGLFLLVGATMLALFGPLPGRRYARLTALSAGGVLLAMLAAIGSYLGETSRIIGQLGATDLAEDQISISRGRGVWCAAAGVVLVLAAIYLAGRMTEYEPEDEESEGEEEPPAVWSWRRPEVEDEGPPDAPFDLTVSAAKPFSASSDNVDKPS
jgi:hypothetical protein